MNNKIKAKTSTDSSKQAAAEPSHDVTSPAKSSPATDISPMKTVKTVELPTPYRFAQYLHRKTSKDDNE